MYILHIYIYILLLFFLARLLNKFLAEKVDYLFTKTYQICHNLFPVFYHLNLQTWLILKHHGLTWLM